MFHEGVAGLPPWLVAGLLVGAAASLLVGLTFLIAGRLFPDRETDRRGETDTPRRREFRQYFETIGEPYAEDHPLEGHTVEFYLPDRDVAVTFDARVYYQIDLTGTHAILAEHEMPWSVLATRLPFETPAVELDDHPDTDRARAAFAELGVTTDASPRELRRAYREKVKATHPDQGGDEESFKRVQEAYATARKHAD